MCLVQEAFSAYHDMKLDRFEEATTATANGNSFHLNLEVVQLSIRTLARTLRPHAKEALNKRARAGKYDQNIT